MILIHFVFNMWELFVKKNIKVLCDMEYAIFSLGHALDQSKSPEMELIIVLVSNSWCVFLAVTGSKRTTSLGLAFLGWLIICQTQSDATPYITAGPYGCHPWQGMLIFYADTNGITSFYVKYQLVWYLSIVQWILWVEAFMTRTACMAAMPFQSSDSAQII